MAKALLEGEGRQSTRRAPRRGPVKRCWWPGEDPLYVRYHDEEWGRPVTRRPAAVREDLPRGLSDRAELDDDSPQAREFPRGVRGLRSRRGARFSARDIARLLKNDGIVRHRGKIESTINNAKRALELIEEYGSLAPTSGVGTGAKNGRRRSRWRAEEDEPDARVHGAVQGPEEARLVVRRTHHHVRLHAGDGVGQRPPRGLRVQGRSGERSRPILAKRSEGSILQLAAPVALRQEQRRKQRPSIDRSGDINRRASSLWRAWTEAAVRIGLSLLDLVSLLPA